MKAHFCIRISLGLALSAVPFVAGCTAQSADNTTGSTNLVTTNSPAASPEAALVETDPSPGTDSATAPAVVETSALPPGAAAATPAPAIKPTSPLGEVVKLAQAGVDEGVMLTFITNSDSGFNLGSDEIIYLNDIGVPNAVVTAILQKDQALKNYWSALAAPPTVPAAPDAEAAAPSYVNSPQPAPAEPQPAIVNNNYFYDTLSPYGSWIDVEGYGRCWQPTVVVGNRSWAPYSDRGRWVYTDSGWYWLSDYSWGWATFHYGRWFNHPARGWCWWPDRVWAPSWVTWRYSGDYCGWAPLPPTAYYRSGFGFTYRGGSVGLNFDFGLGANCFTFVPWNRFCDSRPYHYRLPTHQVTQVFNNTTVVNNYVAGRGNTVINRGISTDRVREHTHAEVRQVNIHDNTTANSHSWRGERLDRDGRTLDVHRPHFSQPMTPNRPGSSRPRAEASPGSTPTAGAAAGVLTENSRPNGHDRDRVLGEVRDREHRSPAANAAPNPNPPARAREERPDSVLREPRPGGHRTVTPSSPIVIGSRNTSPAPTAPVSTPAPQSPVVTAPQPKATPSGSVVVIGRRDSTSTRDHSADRDRRPTDTRTETPTKPATTPSPIVIGSRSTDSATHTTPAPQTSPVVTAPQTRTAPPGSTIVIGRGDSSPTRDRNNDNDRRASVPRNETPANPAQSTRIWTPATPNAPSRQIAEMAPTPPSYNRSATEAQRSFRSEQSRPESRIATPTPIAPRLAAPAPSYSPPAAPAQRSFTPAPSSAPMIQARPSVATPSPAPVIQSRPSASSPSPDRSTSDRDSGRSRRNN